MPLLIGRCSCGKHRVPEMSSSLAIDLHHLTTNMDDVSMHLQCQECLATFPSSELLHLHLEKFRRLFTRIRTWEEECRAHIEPVIEPDSDPDELDKELCHDHPALLKARACPVAGCKKQFGEKKQLNIHFESRIDDLLPPEWIADEVWIRRRLSLCRVLCGMRCRILTHKEIHGPYNTPGSGREAAIIYTNRPKRAARRGSPKATQKAH